MLQRYGFEDLKPVSLPMETSIQLTSAQSPSTTQEIAHMHNIPYQEAVRSLMYASLGTHLDGTMAEDRHAISGYAFLLNGGAVSWAAKRQEIISLSTTESEYVAITHASKEALWLRFLITQLFDTILKPTTLFSDNQSAITLTKDHQYHPRSKHIDVRFHFICWIIENGSI